MVSPGSAAPSESPVVWQSSFWMWLNTDRVCPHDQSWARIHTILTHPAILGRTTPGEDRPPRCLCYGVICFLFIHYPVLYTLGFFISEGTIFFGEKLCQFFNNTSPLEGHSSYSLQLWFSSKLVSEGNSDSEQCNWVL